MLMFYERVCNILEVHNVVNGKSRYFKPEVLQGGKSLDEFSSFRCILTTCYSISVSKRPKKVVLDPFSRKPTLWMESHNFEGVKLTTLWN